MTSDVMGDRHEPDGPTKTWLPFVAASASLAPISAPFGSTSHHCAHRTHAHQWAAKWLQKASERRDPIHSKTYTVIGDTLVHSDSRQSAESPRGALFMLDLVIRQRSARWRGKRGSPMSRSSERTMPTAIRITRVAL